MDALCLLQLSHDWCCYVDFSALLKVWLHPSTGCFRSDLSLISNLIVLFFLLPVIQTSVLARYLPPPCTHSICKDTVFSLFLYFFLCQCCVFRFALLAWPHFTFPEGNRMRGSASTACSLWLREDAWNKKLVSLLWSRMELHIVWLKRSPHVLLKKPFWRHGRQELGKQRPKLL